MIAKVLTITVVICLAAFAVGEAPSLPCQRCSESLKHWWPYPALRIMSYFLDDQQLEVPNKQDWVKITNCVCKRQKSILKNTHALRRILTSFLGPERYFAETVNQLEFGTWHMCAIETLSRDYSDESDFFEIPNAKDPSHRKTNFLGGMFKRNSPNLNDPNIGLSYKRKNKRNKGKPGTVTKKRKTKPKTTSLDKFSEYGQRQRSAQPMPMTTVEALRVDDGTEKTINKNNSLLKNENDGPDPPLSEPISSSSVSHHSLSPSILTSEHNPNDTTHLVDPIPIAYENMETPTRKSAKEETTTTETTPDNSVAIVSFSSIEPGHKATVYHYTSDSSTPSVGTITYTGNIEPADKMNPTVVLTTPEHDLKATVYYSTTDSSPLSVQTIKYTDNNPADNMNPTVVRISPEPDLKATVYYSTTDSSPLSVETIKYNDNNPADNMNPTLVPTSPEPDLKATVYYSTTDSSPLSIETIKYTDNIDPTDNMNPTVVPTTPEPLPAERDADFSSPTIKPDKPISVSIVIDDSSQRSMHLVHSIEKTFVEGKNDVPHDNTVIILTSEPNGTIYTSPEPLPIDENINSSPSAVQSVDLANEMPLVNNESSPKSVETPLIADEFKETPTGSQVDNQQVTLNITSPIAFASSDNNVSTHYKFSEFPLVIESNSETNGNETPLDIILPENLEPPNEIPLASASLLLERAPASRSLITTFKDKVHSIFNHQRRPLSSIFHKDSDTDKRFVNERSPNSLVSSNSLISTSPNSDNNLIFGSNDDNYLSDSDSPDNTSQPKTEPDKVIPENVTSYPTSVKPLSESSISKDSSPVLNIGHSNMTPSESELKGGFNESSSSNNSLYVGGVQQDNTGAKLTYEASDTTNVMATSTESHPAEKDTNFASAIKPIDLAKDTSIVNDVSSQRHMSLVNAVENTLVEEKGGVQQDNIGSNLVSEPNDATFIVATSQEPLRGEDTLSSSEIKPSNSENELLLIKNVDEVQQNNIEINSTSETENDSTVNVPTSAEPLQDTLSSAIKPVDPNNELSKDFKESSQRSMTMVNFAETTLVDDKGGVQQDNIGSNLTSEPNDATVIVPKSQEALPGEETLSSSETKPINSDNELTKVNEVSSQLFVSAANSVENTLYDVNNSVRQVTNELNLPSEANNTYNIILTSPEPPPTEMVTDYFSTIMPDGFLTISVSPELNDYPTESAPTEFIVNGNPTPSSLDILNTVTEITNFNDDSPQSALNFSSQPNLSFVETTENAGKVVDVIIQNNEESQLHRTLGSTATSFAPETSSRIHDVDLMEVHTSTEPNPIVHKENLLEELKRRDKQFTKINIPIPLLVTQLSDSTANAPVLNGSEAENRFSKEKRPDEFIQVKNNLLKIISNSRHIDNTLHSTTTTSPSYLEPLRYYPSTLHSSTVRLTPRQNDNKTKISLRNKNRFLKDVSKSVGKNGKSSENIPQSLSTSYDNYHSQYDIPSTLSSKAGPTHDKSRIIEHALNYIKTKRKNTLKGGFPNQFYHSSFPGYPRKEEVISSHVTSAIPKKPLKDHTSDSDDYFLSYYYDGDGDNNLRRLIKTPNTLDEYGLKKEPTNIFSPTGDEESRFISISTLQNWFNSIIKNLQMYNIVLTNALQKAWAYGKYGS